LTIAVNSGANEKVKAYLKQKDFTFKVLNDKEGVWAQRFSVEAFPTTFLYDSKGELKFTEVGYTTTAGLLARMALLE
jgi:thioredoxin-related protein